VTLSVPGTVTADAQSRLYGEANPSLTYTTTSLGAGAPLSGSLATTAGPTSDVDPYAITQGTLTGTANPNYALTYVGANLAVTPRPLTVTGGTISRAYGDANPATTTAFTAPTGSAGTGSGLVNGDTIASVALASATADATSGVGGYAFTPGSARFGTGSAGNYQISYAPGTLSVTPRPVTVTADAQSRVYGEADPSLTYTTTSLGAGAPLSGTLATADATTGVGSYAITQGTLTGTANPNYALTYIGANLTITPRPLTVTGGTISRAYGDANPATTIAFTAPTGSAGSGSGLVNGDTIASVALASATADAATGVGSYSFTPGSARFSQGSAANYQIGYAPGTLTVTPRPVTVTADAQTRLYGDANPSLTYTTTSLGAGVPLSGSLATADATTGVGSYAITQGTLTASANPNYALTYVGANLTITPRPLIVTGGTISRVYGDANPATTTAFVAPTGSAGSGGGLVNGDTIASVAVASATADATTGVGSYAYTPGSARFGQGSAGNYRISYVPGTLLVMARPVSITADAQTRVYGDANPALTYAVGGRGLVAGDSLSGGLATPATPASGVGPYAITQGTLAASANYVLTYQGADLTVTGRAGHRHGGGQKPRLRRGQPGPDLHHHRAGSGRGPVGDAGHGGHRRFGCRDLRDHAGLAHGRRQPELRAHLCRRRSHHRGAADHGDGGGADAPLRRGRPGPDLHRGRPRTRRRRPPRRRSRQCGRRAKPGRPLRDHAGLAGGLRELRPGLRGRRPDGDAAPGDALRNPRL
jgi:MBG domain (YGX type)